jgi:5-methylcytosine-specific restriction endonuclease McrA
MANSRYGLETLSSADLLNATRDLVRKSHSVEAELLVHLAEIDERKLYLERAFPSMFAFCVDELGFSEDAAYSRILVARAGRRLPALIEALGSGQVHLAGLRLLVPHLTEENHGEVLAQAAGKSKREIEELIARLSPKPPVPSAIRKLPQAACSFPLPYPETRSVDLQTPGPAHVSAAAVLDTPAAASSRVEHRPIVAPLTDQTFKVQFTASRAFKDKLRQAQDPLRHRVVDGDLATILESALDVLIERVQKERFGIGRKPAKARKEAGRTSSSRHIPDAIKRAVYERDGGRCTFIDDRGHRCPETGNLEFDHVEGFARTHEHDVARIRLLCRAHNQYAAEQSYGRAFMESARAGRTRTATCPGTSCAPGVELATTSLHSAEIGPGPVARAPPV